jgi:hypothetical protein
LEKSINFAKKYFEMMKQIISFLMKNINRQILGSSICLFAMNSCYEFEALPDKIKSDYEIAIPVIDATISVGDFVSFSFPDVLLDYIEILEGVPINMGEMEFPFFIGEYSSSQKLNWLEPLMIIDTKDLPSGTIVNLRIYTKNDNERGVYFWLPEDYTITVDNSLMRVPETPSKITNVDQFRHSRKIFLSASIKYPTTVPASKIIKDKVNIRFVMKFEIETDLSINL